MQDTGTSKYKSELTDVIALSKTQCTRPILANLVYSTRDNFVGQIIDGYTPGVSDLALMTKPAALALCEVQNYLNQHHQLGLIIFDSYRPKQAVKHFVQWSTQPVADEHELTQKNKHYPHIEKNRMFELHYVSADSQHCYGHTVDLFLVDKDGRELNHGACFDFMDKLSHLDVTADDIGEEAYQNRQILINAMEKHGYIAYPKEFWHYSFSEKTITEPMDIPITADLKGLNA